MLERISKIIQNEIDERDVLITNKEIAKAVGISTWTIQRLFNADNEPIFITLLNIIKTINPEKEVEIMSLICPLLTRECNKRYAIEYASINRIMPLFRCLLDSFSDAKGFNKEWIDLYSIAYRYQSGETDYFKLLHDIDVVKPKQEETKIAQGILKSRVFRMLEYYKQMFDEVTILEKKINALQDDFLKNTFLLRTYEVFAQGYLYVMSDVKRARKYANNIIRISACVPFVMQAYHILGTSYLFEDYVQAHKYFTQFKITAERNGREDLVKQAKENALFFTNVLWGRNIDETTTSDIIEKAHYLAKWGDKKEALEILKAEEDKKCPYHQCYLGLATENPDYLLQSINIFKSTGNNFMANLPVLYLEKYESYHHIVSIILGKTNIA